MTGDPATTERLLLSARQLATLLGVSTSTVWSWHSSGRIPVPLRIGGSTRWRRSEIERWIDASAPPRGRWQALKEGRDA